VMSATGIVAVLALRTLGYLRVRRTIALWREQAVAAESAGEPRYSRPRPVQLHRTDVRTSEETGRPTVDLSATSADEETHASAA
jgi:hypothetical protein